MNDFEKLIADIEIEAVAEGPVAVAELRALDDRFRLASELLDGVAGAHERAQLGHEQAHAGETVSLDDL